MEIRAAVPGDLDELMDFYAEMSRALDKQDFLPHGNRGGFPSREMVEDAIRDAGQFVGVEDGRIMAAYFLSHDCDRAYETAPCRSGPPGSRCRSSTRCGCCRPAAAGAVPGG